jgi:hypothetical protein
MEVPGNIDIIDGVQSRFADGEFAADHFADLALQQFPNALNSE